jgi:hypothetical protein
MDPSFKPYESGLLIVEEGYPCGKSIGQRGRANVYYLCKCQCGKEFIVTGDELSKHPYSCGCTPKPKSWNGSHEERGENKIQSGHQRTADEDIMAKEWDILFLVFGIVGWNIFYVLGGIFGIVSKEK